MAAEKRNVDFFQGGPPCPHADHKPPGHIPANGRIANQIVEKADHWEFLKNSHSKEYCLTYTNKKNIVTIKKKILSFMYCGSV